MRKKTLDDLNPYSDYGRGQRVLIRTDFNVPLDAAGNILNDHRIRSALPTLQELLKHGAHRSGARVIIMTHLGRPKGDPVKDAPFRTDKVAERLRQLLSAHTNPGLLYWGDDIHLRKVDEVVGPQVEQAVADMLPGEIVVLENLRLHPGETKGDPAFAAQLAKLADVYVNDAFGTCHRGDASMVAVPAAMKGKPRVVGKLVAKELAILDRLLSAPEKPFVAILGGAKVSDKIGFIKAILGRADKVLIGGAMSYTFMKAQGRGVGGSKVEADRLDVARELLELGKGKILLPVDHLVVEKLDAPQGARVVEGDIPDGWVGVDIGPKTIARYEAEVAAGRTVVWNGPLGKYEDEPYSKGTRAIAEALARSQAVTVVGGGETAEAVEQFGLDAKMTHVSTGGGAFLEYVAGTPFPALAEIDDAEKRENGPSPSFPLIDPE